ncbi:MAG: flippase-like domain-containing protein [Candidatus Fermentibacteraceae bacterium]|nr:flippase-like domain-containing protein [Candidatus Fermentibacteraceae bacterium]
MKKAVWGIVIAIAVYTVLVLRSDIQNVVSAADSVNPVWIPLFLILPLFNYAVRFLKWQYFLHRIEVKVPVKESFLVFIAGFSMTVSPGKMGELLKCSLLKKRRNIPIEKTSPVVVAERLTDLISMVLLALIGALLVKSRIALPAAGAGAVFVAAAMFIVMNRRAWDLFSKVAHRIPFLGKRKHLFDDFRDASVKLLDMKSLAVSVPIGMVSWGIEALVLCVVAASMGYHLPPGVALLSHAAGSVAGAISMIPGGLGLTEITIDGILCDYLPAATATVTTLLMRFATLWFSVVLGITALIALKKNQ